MARGCNAHCLSCDSHFSGTDAFDMHRVGNYRSGGFRHCMNPEAIPELSFIVTHCRVAEGKAKGESVKVWHSIEAREKLSKAFQGRR